MWPVRVSNPGLLALESDVLPTALRGPAVLRGRGPVCSVKRVCLAQTPRLFAKVQFRPIRR